MTIYKTRNEHVADAEKLILSLHKNQTPCVIRIAEVTANTSYEEWVQSETDRTQAIDPIP